MPASFTIHRLIDRPIEFRGLKGPYIIRAAVLLVADMILFAILYIASVNSWICVALSFTIGGAGLTILYRRSARYGAYGWAKHQAARHIPRSIRCNSRYFFIDLKKHHGKVN